MGVLQRTRTSLAPSLYRKFSMSILKYSVKRAPVKSMFIDGLSLQLKHNNYPTEPAGHFATVNFNTTLTLQSLVQDNLPR